MAREHTENQRRVIESDGSDLCVAAGAGSGKTGVLVERYIRLIVQSREGKLPPELQAGVEKILVITFTEKATKEMKARIVERLASLGLIEERRKIETAYISTIHGFCSRLLQENPFEAGVDPRFTVFDETQARRLFRQSFEHVISNAFERGDREIIELVAAAQGAKSPSYETADPMTQLANSVEKTLSSLRGAGRTLEEVEALWEAGVEETTNRNINPVLRLINPLLIEIRAASLALKLVSNSLTGMAKLLCDQLLALMEPLESSPPLAPLATTQPNFTIDPNAVRQSRSSSEEPETQTITANFQSLQRQIEIISEIGAALGKSKRRFGIAPGEMELMQWAGRLKILTDEAFILFRVAAEQEELAGLASHRMWGLVVAVWKAYRAEKRKLGKADSDDLQAEAVRLLESSPAVLTRYRKLFRYLMVDEFQDTNPLQMRLIQLLHHPKAAIPQYRSHTEIAIPPNHLFVVGDVQQSIYGFRSAEPELFRNLEREYRENRAGAHVSLAVNFRSRPEILRLIEQTFRQIWRDSETPFVPLSSGAPFDAKPAPSVEILVTAGLMRRDYVNAEAEGLASRIKHMVESGEHRITSRLDARCGEAVDYRDIAILLRSLTDIQRYEEAFAKRAVPYFVVGGGRGYYARQEIRDLLNVLIALDTPTNDLSLLAALRSPFVGLQVDSLYRLQLCARDFPAVKESRKGASPPLYPSIKRLIESGELPPSEAQKLTTFVTILDRLRDEEDRLPVGHLLERLISATQYDARLLCRPGGRRRLANVRKLLQIANADSVMGVREFILRLKDMEKLSDREGDAPTEEEEANVVRFITVHGAKGLEFPVVILADLCRSIEFAERGLFNCDPRSLSLGTRLPSEPSLSYRSIDRQRQRDEQEEAERLLYVAMTRAREHLVLCGNLGKNRGINLGDRLFSGLGVLEMPHQPTVQTLIGGIEAQIAPLSHYSGVSPARLPDSGSKPGIGARTSREAQLEAALFELSKIDFPDFADS